MGDVRGLPRGPAPPAGTGPGAPRRNGAPAGLPGTRGGPAARRAAERPAAGPGRPAEAGRARLHRDDLRAVLPVLDDRPAATEETVPLLDRAALADRHRAILDPRCATLVVGGDLEGLSITDMVAEQFGDWMTAAERAAPATTDASRPSRRTARRRRRPAGSAPDRGPDRSRRPAAPDPGLPRRRGHERDPGRSLQLPAAAPAPGGARLHVLAWAPASTSGGRRGRSPSGWRSRRPPRCRPWWTRWASCGASARSRRRRTSSDVAREYLIGVFPLRFEAPSQVVAAIGGLVAHRLPDDELDRYRPAIARVTRRAMSWPRPGTSTRTARLSCWWGMPRVSRRTSVRRASAPVTMLREPAGVADAP